MKSNGGLTKQVSSKKLLRSLSNMYMDPCSYVCVCVHVYIHIHYRKLIQMPDTKRKENIIFKGSHDSTYAPQVQ